MKKIKLTAIMILLSAIIICFTNKKNNNDIDKIFKIILKQESDWNEGKIEDFMIAYEQSDSIQFITKKGITYGWQNVLNNYKKSYPDKTSMGKLSFKNIKIRLLKSNMAHVTGIWDIALADKNVNGNFSLIFIQKAKDWKIIIDHTW